VTLVRRAARSLPHLALAGLLFAFGVFLHELGHGIAATLLGVRIVRINVVGVDIWPDFRLNLEHGYWGRIWWRGTLTPVESAWVGLSGNLATMSASLAALPLLLYLPRGAPASGQRGQIPRRPFVRTALVVLSLYFMDTLLHTLPTLGLPMYVLFGRRDPASVSEGYLSAQTLGCPGPVFQGAIVTYSLVAFGAIVCKLLDRFRT
jgi:hypothetical protein